MSQEIIPREINSILDGESADFVVRANRKSGQSALGRLWMGLFFSVFSIAIGIAFFGPLFLGEEVHFLSNKAPTVASPSNLKPIIGPALIIGFFFLSGIGITAHSVFSLGSKGAWYIGTAKRLIVYLPNKIRSIPWEQISGDIEVRGTPEYGSINLRVRTAGVLTDRKGEQYQIRDMLEMVGIKNCFQIEQIIRKRINENNPPSSLNRP